MKQFPDVQIPSDDEATKTIAEPFLVVYWTWLAAKAWRGYCHLGRGALILPWSIVNLTAHTPLPFDVAYETEFEDPLVEDLLREYSPEQSIVVVFIEDPLPYVHGPVPLLSGLWAAIYAHEPSPPRAHVLRAN